MNRAKIQEANRKFYEAVAGFYEEVDSRRGHEHAWLDKVLEDLAASAPKDAVFLDLGSGSGFLGQKALQLFPRVIAVDISPAMLARLPDSRMEKICAPCENLPLADASVDVIGAFATLHHLFDPVETLRECYRVLRPGGIFFSDHDIEARFVGNFGFPLKIYRSFFDHGPAYLARAPELSQEDYVQSEYHGDRGIDGTALAKAAKALGFRECRLEYHWAGLLPVTPPWKLRGLSPLLRLIARK